MVYMAAWGRLKGKPGILDYDKEFNHYKSYIEEAHKKALLRITGIIEKIELLNLTREFFRN